MYRPVSSDLDPIQNSPLSPCSKWTLVAFIIGSVAGIIIIGIGAADMFGSVGTTGFIGSVAGGGTLAAVSIGGIIWIALTNCKDQKEETTTTSPQSVPSHLQACHNLRDISEDFFENKSQEKAKLQFAKAMHETFGCQVVYPKSREVFAPEDIKEGPFDPTVFRLSESTDVGNDIIRASADPDHLHVFQVPSHYNASQAVSVETPRIGQAIDLVRHSNHQGIQAHRSNPVALEFVNAFLTNLGFNMLDQVLPSAGTTYQKDGPIEHGFLRPNKGNLETLTNEFKQNYSKAEFVCYSSHMAEWGENTYPVEIFLQGSPAMGNTSLSKNQHKDELEKYAALANYSALFDYGIQRSYQQNRPVILHVKAMGDGPFENHIENIRWGFEKAAHSYESVLKSCGIVVQLDAPTEYCDYESVLKSRGIVVQLDAPTGYCDIAIIARNLGILKPGHLG